MLTKEEKKAESKKRMKAYQRKYHKKRYQQVKKDQLAPVEKVETFHPQYLLFLQDCTFPCLETWTKFTRIFSTYRKYCQALGQEMEYGRIPFAKLLAKSFNKKMTANGSLYNCAIRSEIFLQVTKTPDVEPLFYVDGVPMTQEEKGGQDGGLQD